MELGHLYGYIAEFRLWSWGRRIRLVSLGASRLLIGFVPMLF